jgi:hypothetical protein
MKRTKQSAPSVEDYIRSSFKDNFNRLRAESGHTLSPEVKQAALDQVLFYWRKLSDLAMRITETEVRLNLPNQKTKKKRIFSIQGVVDIVREDDRVTMYDLKTHLPEYVLKYRDKYEEQLNVYAYIWQKLRGQRLDETAVITTQFPQPLSEAMSSKDDARIAEEVAKWDPVIPITFDTSHVGRIIAQFAEIVDAIEDGNFSPPPLERLREIEVEGKTFGSRVCSNCDVRFSCNSFRSFSKVSKNARLKEFRRLYDDEISEAEAEERFETAMPGV